MHISQLPPELILSIVEDLPKEDAYSFAATCRDFQNTCLPGCLRHSGIDLSTNNFHFSESHFGPPLAALARVSYLDGMDLGELFCDLPSPVVRGSALQMDTLKRVLQRPRKIEQLTFKFFVGSLISSAKDWLRALADLLCVVGTKVQQVSFLAPAPMTFQNDFGSFDAQAWTHLNPLPSKLVLRTLQISGPAYVLQVIAIRLYGVESITSLVLNACVEETTTKLKEVLFPNLEECSFRGLRLDDDSLRTFLACHPNIRFLNANFLAEQPTLSYAPMPSMPSRPLYPKETDADSLSTQNIPLALPTLAHLVASIPSALFILKPPHTIPNLRRLEISPGPHSPSRVTFPAESFWNLLASNESFPNLETLVIQSSAVARVLLHPKLPPPERAIRSIKILLLEGSSLDRSRITSLSPEPVKNLPKWLPVAFPNLQSLTIRNMLVFKSAGDEQAFISSLRGMHGISPTIDVRHDRPPKYSA
ncbi:hypothetical protein ONZ45_g6214 [Pleurotus djamor]|nr:hypothetical protein ONZ45_g6214 [Pleurotus djamor]